MLGTLLGGQLRPNSPCRAPLHATSSSPDRRSLLPRIAAHRATVVRAQPLLAEPRACPAPTLPAFWPAAAPRSRRRRSPAALLRRAAYLASPRIHLPPPPPLASPAPLLCIMPPARSRPAPLDLRHAHALCCCPLLRAVAALPRPRTTPPPGTVAKRRRPPLYPASAAPYSRARRRHPALAPLATLLRPGPPRWPPMSRRPRAPTAAPEPLPLAGAPPCPGDATLGLALSGARARAQ
nr:extensin-like [Aegilops tauschii subsp. strangulata]